MNLKNESLPVWILIFTSAILVLVIVLQFYSNETHGLNNRVSTDKDQDNQLRKTLTYRENSLDGTKQIIRYSFNNHPELFTDYKDYLNNNVFIALKDLADNKESYVFIGEERTNNPHWLGNEHIFFTTYCGTACKGIYLVNILNKDTELGIFSYIYSDQKNVQVTHFKDWFNNSFEFPGWVKNIHSSYFDNKVYLIFEMWNNNKYMGGKRFIFTGSSLKEQ